MENKRWSDSVVKKDQSFFHMLAQSQHPDVLWIGCSDSRVPAETIVNAIPGKMFVHRNIANQVIMTDFNSLSVIQYAVAVLKIKHIIVCGHYGCGGIKAALGSQNSNLNITNKWLMHIKDTYRLHHSVLDELDEEMRFNKLVELNVIEQVRRLSHTSIIQTPWKTEQYPTIHGWVYRLEDGILQELITLDHSSMILPIYSHKD
jgi:carbonic anhydrase